MSHRLLTGLGLLLVVNVPMLATETAPLPLVNGRPVVASVNRDAISLDEFVARLATAVNRPRLQAGRGSASELELLDRLVTIKLLYQEAVTMGIADLPEVRKQIDVTSREILREVLLDRLVKDVKADPAAVEKKFRELSKQWKTESLLFRDEVTAKRAKAELDAGSPFGDVAARAVAAKAAQAENDTAYHRGSDYLPPVAAAVAQLRAGQVGPLVRVQTGYVVFKVVDLRHPEDAPLRAQARKSVLDEQRLAALKVHEAAQRKQYATVNSALLKSIDYEAAKPGIDALLKDARVVAELKGGKPVTVGDLTDYLRMQFFHGSDAAKQHKDMNQKKEEALDATVGRRLLNMEAARLGIDKSIAYRDRVKGFRESLVFDTFIQKVIAPGNKMREEEVRQYYRSHPKEYSNPPMIKARSLAFTTRASAEAALKKAREGADFRWLAANADGQVSANAPDVLRFDGRPVMLTTLPADLEKVLAGSRSGELRLYSAADGRTYVLSVEQVIQPDPRPYEDVREEIAKKLYNEKLQKSVVEYAGKLRAQAKVATYLKKAQP